MFVAVLLMTAKSSETKQMPINRRMNKEVVVQVQPYNGVPLRKQKDQTTDTGYNVNQSQLVINKKAKHYKVHSV